MTPEHYALAQKELDLLRAEGLIEGTSSPWACQAFYVNKRAEQIRGKLRLVINYQPLNHFLSDDKFPLPHRTNLFSQLASAKVFSKFDLKAGFWQLGIHPEERFKTAFCIPNFHYQWTVMPFGLKTAPSLFQKAMTRIFEPILSSALIYIDDILLFSPDEQTHLQLLQQFYDIVRQYGIMLSAKKMVVATRSIDFLGLHINEGRIVPQPHIASQLLQFPDHNLTKTQVQQFLGIVNYIADFIPKLTTIVKPLQQLLKKLPPPWNQSHTQAILKLKALIPSLPPLHLPTDGLRILQTDASDQYWSAVLLEQAGGSTKVCGYKSGSFKDSELHYHSTYKEILAVKRGIQKFQFHLINHHFQIQTDMSAFPKMLQFKQKELPSKLLLRWQEWFANFSFEVKHIPGKQNVLADFLSRPIKQQTSAIPFLAMVNPLPTQPPEWPVIFNSPSEIHKTMISYQLQTIRKYGPHHLGGIIVHPEYPFATLFHWLPHMPFPQELLWFLWYLLDQCTIGIQFHVQTCQQWFQPSRLPPHAQQFMEWFHPLSYWQALFQTITLRSNTLSTTPHKWYIILLFTRKKWFSTNNPSVFSCRYTSTYQEYGLIPFNLHQAWNAYPQEAREFQRHLFEVNHTVPKQLWPKLHEDAPWEFYPPGFSLQIREAQSEYAASSRAANPPPCNPSSSSRPTSKSKGKQKQASPDESPPSDPEDPSLWWKRLGLPPASDDSDEPGPECNLGTP